MGDHFGPGRPVLKSSGLPPRELRGDQLKAVAFVGDECRFTTASLGQYRTAMSSPRPAA
jgi:hypothetical protein